MGRAPVVDATVDEDTFCVPADWWRRADPFRGRGPAPRLTPDPGATRTVAGLVDQNKPRLGQALTDPASDADLAEAARLHLGTGGGLFRRARQEPNPLGAAVVASLVATADATTSTAVVDSWVLSGGVPFAAEAAALVSGIRVSAAGPPAYHPRVTRSTTASPSLGMGRYVLYRSLFSRVRAYLAAADDATYARVRERVGALRDAPVEVRIATSYLLPTEQAWVDDDIATVSAGGGPGDALAPLLASVTSATQADAVVSASRPWFLLQSTSWMYSLAANVGPAAAPVLARMLDADLESGANKRLAGLLAQLPSDEAFTLLIERIDRKHVPAAVMAAMSRFPRRAMRLLAAAAAGKGASAEAARNLLEGHAVSHPDLAAAVAPMVDRGAAAALEAAATSRVSPPGADSDDLPPLLVSPPWTTRKAVPQPTVVVDVGRTSPPRLAWKPGERDEWARTEPGYWWLATEGGPAHHIDRALRERPGLQIPLLAVGPEDQVRRHLARATPTHTYGTEPALRRILGRFGDEAAAYVLRAVSLQPTGLAHLLLPYEGSEVTGWMAEWLSNSKKLRPLAVTWFERHAEAAAADLVPVAVGTPGKERSHAEAALRLLAGRGHRQAVESAAGELGPAVAEAVEAVLATDPLQLLPARMPKLPSWLEPAQLPPVRLADGGGALPDTAVAHLCTMVAISKPDEPYPGIDVVRPALDAGSLAALAWAMFERWQAAGYPSKESWILQGLGLFGDDDTVRRLSPLISSWPGQAAHARAVAALDVLSAIGTDVALLHLHSIAEKARFRGLRSKAQEKIEEVADGLGLSPDQLADRLVPDFGLDAHGSMTLDYGRRRFRVTFDEQLRPVVTDENGSRRKVLPRPGAKDDPALAPAAYARYSGLKKDVKTVAEDQIRRFERAMVTGRRWPAADQRSLFVDHPLLWHLARRVVWGVYEDGRLTGSFRVAEDRTLADERDGEVPAPGGASVGIAHPLHLGDALPAWSEVFADYELLQPFPQLGREVYRLADEEKRATDLTRFRGQVVYSGRLLALAHRGWERGMAEDGGMHGHVYKRLPDDRAVAIEFTPGLVAGEPMHFPEQTIQAVRLHATPPGGGVQPALTFGALDEVTASEVLRDLHTLVP